MSTPTSPFPGKCLAVAATPAAWSRARSPRRVRLRLPGRHQTSGPRGPDCPGWRRGHTRGVVHVHSDRTQLGANRTGDPLGQVRVAGRPERHVAGERVPSPSAMLVRPPDRPQPAAADRGVRPPEAHRSTCGPARRWRRSRARRCWRPARPPADPRSRAGRSVPSKASIRRPRTASSDPGTAGVGHP